MRFQFPYTPGPDDYGYGDGEWPFTMSSGEGRGDCGDMRMGMGIIGDGVGGGDSYHDWRETHLLHGYTMLDMVLCVQQF